MSIGDFSQSTAASTAAGISPPSSQCQWCGLYHGPKCPSVAAIEYHENGQVKRVEFFDATGANGRRLSTASPFAAQIIPTPGQPR